MKLTRANTVQENPNELKHLVDSVPPWIGGFVFSFVLSFVRVIYEKEETTFVRIMLESLICGALTVATGSILEQMGYGQHWYLGVGGIIGFMGTQSVRALANRLLNKKVDKL